jgi:anti-anti-sigma regulatory factor
MTANNCKNMDIDISTLNFIDAAKVCILCSTFHFAKYIDGRIRWLVKDEIVKRQIMPMKLSNIEIETRRGVKLFQKQNLLQA